MFYYLPLAGTISEDLGEEFKKFYDNAPPPNNALSLMVYEVDPGLSLPVEEQFKKYFRLPKPSSGTGNSEFWHYPEETYDQLKAAVRFRALVSHYFGNKIIPIRTRDMTRVSGGIDIYENYPTGMSEVMGMMLISFGWDSVKDRDKIGRLVQNWTQKGELGNYWGIEGFEFETGLDEENIVGTMEKIEADIDRAAQIYAKYKHLVQECRTEQGVNIVKLRENLKDLAENDRKDIMFVHPLQFTDS